MALDRTWYNTLVDDDGSGTTGSIWDKADVDSLMDAIDAQLAAVAGPTTGTWTPVLQFGGLSTGITYAAQVGTYTKTGNVYIAEFRIALTSKGSATGTATITGAPGTAAGTPIGSPLDFAVAGTGLPAGAHFSLMSGAILYLAYQTSTIRNQLNDTHFTNTTDIRGSIVFRT